MTELNKSTTEGQQQDKGLPMKTNAPGPSTHLFVAPLPKLPPAGISKNVTDHDEDCYYNQWNTVHRQSLLTTNDVMEYLFQFEKRTKGKNKLEKNMEEVIRKLNENVARPLVQRYLEGSRRKYENRKQVMLDMCECSQDNVNPVQSIAEVSLNVGATPTTTTSAPHPSVRPESWVQETGLNLSESESDEEEMSAVQEKCEKMDTEVNPCTTAKVTDDQCPSSNFEAPEYSIQSNYSHANGDFEREDILKFSEGETNKENIRQESDTIAVRMDTSERQPESARLDAAKMAIIRSCGLDLSDDELDYEEGDD